MRNFTYNNRVRAWLAAMLVAVAAGTGRRAMLLDRLRSTGSASSGSGKAAGGWPARTSGEVSPRSGGAKKGLSVRCCRELQQSIIVNPSNRPPQSYRPPPRIARYDGGRRRWAIVNGLAMTYGSSTCLPPIPRAATVDRRGKRMSNEGGPRYSRTWYSPAPRARGVSSGCGPTYDKMRPADSELLRKQKSAFETVGLARLQRPDRDKITGALRGRARADYSDEYLQPAAKHVGNQAVTQ